MILIYTNISDNTTLTTHTYCIDIGYSRRLDGL